MSEQENTLEPRSALCGFEKSWESFSIRENTKGELLSLSVSKANEHAFISKFQEHFATMPPEPNCTASTTHGIVFWTAPRQWFLWIDEEDAFADIKLRSVFGETTAITLQSDAWAQIDISGNNMSAVLERLVNIDLSEQHFPAGRAIRTQVHHMNCFILRLSEQKNHIRFLCARSYSRSFIHALERTVTTLLGPATKTRYETF